MALRTLYKTGPTSDWAGQTNPTASTILSKTDGVGSSPANSAGGVLCGLTRVLSKVLGGNS